MADDSSEIVKEQSESVAASNLKVLGDGPAFYSSLAMGNAVAHQQGMQTILTAIVGKVAEAVISTTPGEGGVDVAGLQVLSKMAGNTPPVTP